MKILYVSQYYPPEIGAPAARVSELARLWADRGHEVTVLTAFPQHPFGRKLPGDRGVWTRRERDGQVDVVRTYIFAGPNAGFWRRIASFVSFMLSAMLIGPFRVGRPDVVIATSPQLFTAVAGRWISWIKRAPFVFEVRDLWPELPRALGLRNPFVLGGMSLLEFLGYRSADACIGLAPGIVEGIRRRAAESLPVATIPNGCDLEVFHPSRRAPLDLPGVAPDDFVAGFTGAHGVANGLDALLDVALELKRRGDRRVKLAFFGDGKEKERLVARAAELGLANCLFFPPVPKERLGAITASLGCGLMTLKDVPAFYQGTSPNKFFDYVAAGLPVVNNYPGWLAGLIRDHECGIVVPPGDPAAFADALQRLAADPAACRVMGAAARALAEKQFARPLLSARFVATLEAACP